MQALQASSASKTSHWGFSRMTMHARLFADRVKRRGKVDADRARMLGPALSKPTLISLTPDLADIPTLLGKAEPHDT